MIDDAERERSLFLNRFINKIEEQKQINIVFVSLLTIFSIYIFQFSSITFNADDVIQIQSISRDALTFLPKGRWGLFLVFEYIQDNNPGGVFLGFVGLCFLFASALLSAKIIGIRSNLGLFAFTTLASVSIYYGFLYDFTSSRLAYPIANFFALLGLYAVFRRRLLIGVVLISIAPAFYPASIEIAGATLISATIAGLTWDRERPLRKFLIGGAAILLGLVLYVLVYQALLVVLDIPKHPSTGSSWRAVEANFSRILWLFKNHSIPFVSWQKWSYYVSNLYVVPLGVVFAVFLAFVGLRAWRSGGALRLGLVLVLTFLSLLVPYAFIFVSVRADYPPRSLVAFATVQAVWVAVVVEDLATRPTVRRSVVTYVKGAALLCGLLLLFEHGSQINKRAYDRTLATKSDFLATNRIIMRIEDLFAEAGRPIGSPQALVVIVRNGKAAGPRGEAGSARFHPWSKEWVFRLVDNRFIPASAAEMDKAKASAVGRSAWPSRNSVYLQGAAVVVIVGK